MDSRFLTKMRIAIGGRWKIAVFLSAVIVLFLGWGVRALSSRESTDDAFVDGDVIPISPKVPGHIAAVSIADNQQVNAGDPLFTIDDRDYAVRFDLAQAELKAARAEADQARQDADRYRKLAETNDVSQQQVDKAVLRQHVAEAEADADLARLRQAELNLSYTRVSAPVTGRVTRKTVEPGSFVQEGQVLLTIVPPQRWVTANFKETQMTRIRSGLRATIRIDAYPGMILRGHVDSVQQGTGSRFSLLPAENATGNFIKVVQRVPVKIVFDDPLDPKNPLALGISAVPTVDLK